MRQKAAESSGWSLREGTPLPILRPEQWAWMNARAAAGGRTFVLYRMQHVNSWWLFRLSGMVVDTHSKGLKIISPPVASGTTAGELHAAILKLL